MKIWIQPELEILVITETQYGGRKSGNYDNMWMDNEGNECMTYCCS